MERKRKIHYSFHNQSVKINMNGREEVFNFLELPDGRFDLASTISILEDTSIVSAEKKDGTLWLTLEANTEYSNLIEDEWIDAENLEYFYNTDSLPVASFDWADESRQLDNIKEIKKEELSNICKEEILNGFYSHVKGSSHFFSYGVEKQQNFSDTIRLFENNMIDKIGWNAYLEEEKVRIQLDKEMFKAVYLAGVKHKTDCLTRLNDVLYPLVDAAESKEIAARIYWDEGLPAEELSLKEGESIDDQIGQLSKKDRDLEQANMMTMMALVQISGQIK